MNFLNYIKTTILFLLTFFLGATQAHAKTELVLPLKQVVFSVEQTQKISTLDKEVQPNVGFLKEKSKFVGVECVSAVKPYNFYRSFVGNLVQAGDDLLVGIKNTLKSVGITDVNILSKLDNWQTSTLTRFDGIINNPNYAGILNEFKLNTDLFDKFKLVEETWWAKYSMAGLSKCSAFTVPTQFKKYIGDIEVTVSGTGKLKLKNISLDEASGQYLGKLFDDVITQNVKSSWISGDFSQFPTTIQNYLSNLKSQGYKLVVEPQLTVLGKNPKPDFLLVKKEIIAGVTTYDVKYLEIKYLDDVPYTPSQKAITENVPVQVIKKDLDRMYDVNNIEVVPFNTHITVNEVIKLTVDKSTLEMILQ